MLFLLWDPAAAYPHHASQTFGLLTENILTSSDILTSQVKSFAFYATAGGWDYERARENHPEKGKEKQRRLRLCFSFGIRQLPILPCRRQHSTFGV